jgi:hypothetical protein
MSMHHSVDALNFTVLSNGTCHTGALCSLHTTELQAALRAACSLQYALVRHRLYVNIGWTSSDDILWRNEPTEPDTMKNSELYTLDMKRRWVSCNSTHYSWQILNIATDDSLIHTKCQLTMSTFKTSLRLGYCIQKWNPILHTLSIPHFWQYILQKWIKNQLINLNCEFLH